MPVKKKSKAHPRDWSDQTIYDRMLGLFQIQAQWRLTQLINTLQLSRRQALRIITRLQQEQKVVKITKKFGSYFMRGSLTTPQASSPDITSTPEPMLVIKLPRNPEGQKILQCVIDHPNATFQTIMTITALPIKTVQDWIGSFVSYGWIAATEETKRTKMLQAYHLTAQKYQIMPQ